MGKTFWPSQETDLSKQKVPFSQTNVSLSILVDFRPFSGNGPGERNCRNKICRKQNSQNGPIQQEFCLLNFSIGLNFFNLFLVFCLKKIWIFLNFLDFYLFFSFLLLSDFFLDFLLKSFGPFLNFLYFFPMILDFFLPIWPH